ncbi:response regulator transcription factor [Kitasatospora sp. NPDC056531]|uniref:response regulator transcription factor n=1 Tax=Kitasatospora sp. NPDC056531 TaxID=3345856 RepID=UPI00368B0F56
MELLDQAEALLEVAAYDPREWLTARLLRAVVQDLRFDAATWETLEQARPAALTMGDHAALVLAASGRPEDAREADRAALSRFELVAAAGDIDRAAAALRAHGLRSGATGPRRRPRHGWAALTDAESRVAALVAQGLTDREIAFRLVVSVRTVHTHVSRILAKLGCSSRVEIVLGFQPRG